MPGVYISFPFCAQKCTFCNFASGVFPPGLEQQYLEVLRSEVERHAFAWRPETLYIGGGTPSRIPVAELERILRPIPGRPWSEATVEAAPGSVTPEKAAAWVAAGINRVSLGVQSWYDDDLKLLNRRHNSAQASAALEMIFKAGFGNVTIDLIYGIPGMGTERWESNLDKTLMTGISHLSAYHMTIEKGTVFGKMKEKDLLREIDEEESTAQFNMLIDKTGSSGFIQYEISNFAKPGFFSVHNTNYWKQVPYLGLGPSAHSFNSYSRQWNVRDLKKYIKGINGRREFFEREELDLKTRFNEYAMTSLRTMWGMDLEYVEKTFEKEGYDYVINLAGKYIGYGLMKQEKNTLVLTNQGKMISDNIISEFMMPADN